MRDISMRLPVRFLISFNRFLQLGNGAPSARKVDFERNRHRSMLSLSHWQTIAAVRLPPRTTGTISINGVEEMIIAAGMLGPHVFGKAVPFAEDKTD